MYKCWMLILLEDARRVPRIFFPFGAIPEAELTEWLRRNALVLPNDLLELWQLTGGGDVFDSETIFRPAVPSIPNTSFVEDDIEGARALGMRAILLDRDGLRPDEDERIDTLLALPAALGLVHS